VCKIVRKSVGEFLKAWPGHSSRARFLLLSGVGVYVCTGTVTMTSRFLSIVVCIPGKVLIGSRSMTVLMFRSHRVASPEDTSKS
jgi:hypothetical protein